MTQGNLFLQRLQEKAFLLADGATGTNLFALGLMTGDAPELWNIDYPERVAQHYRSFIDAGSDIILTNTFGGNRRRLMLHHAHERVEELNAAAVKILQEEIQRSGRNIVIAGSMGPTGDILAPNGPLTHTEAADVFAEQAQALAKAGADVLWLETLSSKEEVAAAVEGAGRVNLPLVTTLSIDTNGRTMMGLTAADIVNLQPELHPHPIACGTNCGIGAAEVVAAILNFKQALGNDEAIIIAKANCGIPEYIDGAVVYNGTPDLMAEYVKLCMDAGARIIGGCCGTTPSHIRHMRQAMDRHIPGETPSLDTILQTLGPVSKGAQAQLSGDLSVAGGAVSGGKRERRSSRRR